MKPNNQKLGQKEKTVLISIAILLVLLIIAMIAVASKPKEEVITAEQEVQIAKQKIENKTIDKLSQMNEEERMRFYLTDFIEKIETKKYDEAYAVLNSDFKDNFFKTSEEFETYAENNFPSDIAIKYDNFERNGEIYIFWITITNPLTASKNEGKEMNIVIKENNLNDYEMSFSVNL